MHENCRAAASRNNHSNELSNGDSDQSKSKQSTPKVKKKVEVSDSDLNMSSSGNEKPGNDSNEPRRYKSLRLIMKQLKENEETEKLGADTQLSKALKRNKKHIGVREKHVKKNEASKTRRQMVHCHTKSELAVSKELKKLTKLIDENFETDNNDIDNSYTFSFKGNGRILENTNMLNPVGKHQPNNVSKELPTKPITRRTKELLHIDSGQPLPKKARMDNEENVDVNVHAYLSGTVVPRGSVTVSILKPLPVRFNNVQNSAKLDLDLQNKLGNHHAKNCAEVKQDEVHTLRNNVQNNDTRTSTGDAEPLLEYSVNNICSVSEALKKSNNSMPIVESHPSSQLSQNSDEESATRCGILGKQTENRDSETALQQLSVDLVRICNKDTNFNQIKFKVCSNDQDRSFVIVTSSEASTNHENDKNSVKECTSSCETVVENKNSFLNEKSPSKESDISVSMSNLHTSQEMLNQNIMVPEGGVCVESANNDLKIPVNERIDVECASVGLGDVLMEDRPQYREVQMEKGSFAREPLEGTKKQERTVLTGIVEDKVAHTVDETCVDKGAMDFFGNSQMEDNTFSLETQLRADCIDNVNPGITSLCSNHNEDTTVMDPIAKKLTMNLRTKSLREKPSKNVKRLESDCETSTSAEILISSSAKLVRQSHVRIQSSMFFSETCRKHNCRELKTFTF